MADLSKTWEARHITGAGWQLIAPCGKQNFVEGITGDKYPMFVENFVQFPTKDWREQVDTAARRIAACMNACHGKTIEELEAWAEFNFPGLKETS